jgi:hypothetical protein
MMPASVTAHGLIRIRGRAHDQPSAEAEVHQLHLAFVIEHDVQGFEVAMNDALVVRLLQCLRNAARDEQALVGSKGAACQFVRKGRAAHVFHRDEELALEFTRFIDTADGGVVQSGRGALPSTRAQRRRRSAYRQRELEPLRWSTVSPPDTRHSCHRSVAPSPGAGEHPTDHLIRIQDPKCAHILAEGRRPPTPIPD